MSKLPRILAFLTIALVYHSSPVLSQEVDRGLFQPSSIISVEIAKKELKKIYLDGGHPKTLHCGCVFDKIQQVYSGNCDQGLRSTGKQERKLLGWMHAVPPSAFANSLKCWNEPICRQADGTAYQGAGCCAVMSHKFKTREADMHNLFPAIAPEKGQSISSKETRFGGMEEYRFCSAENTPPLLPRPGVRGDVARAYFYMAFQYKFKIPENLEDQLRQWHLADPPDKWEEERNSVIEIVQGNRNPFIDRPELAERVRDF